MIATVRDIIRKKGNEVVAVLQDVSVFEALGLMKEKATGALLVSDKMGRAVGIVSDRDCTQKIILDDKPAKQTSVSKIMNRDINGISMKNTVEECITVMLDKNIRHLPFFDGSDVAGLISIGDTVKSIVKKQRVEINSSATTSLGAICKVRNNID